MAEGFAFGLAAGLLAQQAIMLFLPSLIEAWREGRKIRRQKSKRSWEIGGQTFTIRPLTRSVMEQLTQVHAELSSEPSAQVPSLIGGMLGLAPEDEDERREHYVRIQNERIKATYETLLIVLVDENGDSPAADFLDEHLTTQLAVEIVGEVFTT